MKKKLSTTEFIRKRQAGSPEEGEVIDPNEEMASGFAGGREPGKAEEAFRALVEGSQGFLGLEPGRRGSEAYRTGQALSNLPALALPAAAIKGTGKAKDLLEEAFRQRKTPGLEKFLEKSAVKERVYRGQRRAPGEEGFALTQGRANPSFTLDPEVANVYSRQLGWGTPEYGPGSTVVPAYLQMENPLDIRNLGEYFNLEDFVQKLPKVDLNKPTVESGFGYEDIAQMVRGIGSVANKTGARYEIDASLPGGLYRIKDFGELADAIEEMGSAGKSDEIQKLLFDAKIDAFLIGDSKNVRNALKERGFDGVIHKDAFDVGGEYYEGDLSRLEGGTDAEFVHDTYRPFYQEKIKSAVGNVGDYDTTQKAITKAKGGEVSTTDFIRKREKGSPPEGEVPTDDYIQQMFTGTPPSDKSTFNIGNLLTQYGISPADAAAFLGKAGAGVSLAMQPSEARGMTMDEYLAMKQASLDFEGAAPSETNAARAMLQAIKSRNPAQGAQAAQEMMRVYSGYGDEIKGRFDVSKTSPKSDMGRALYGSDSPAVASESAIGRQAARGILPEAAAVYPLDVPKKSILFLEQEYPSALALKLKKFANKTPIPEGPTVTGNDLYESIRKLPKEKQGEAVRLLGFKGAQFLPGGKALSTGNFAIFDTDGTVSAITGKQFQEGGEVTNDEYIQQMMTGTPPSDRTTNSGLLPPELRNVVDVPLDLANTFIRSAAGAVAGPVYGLYKGITSDKFGTPKGVQEASSEAGRMMQKITGTPKTQAARDVLETIGNVAQEAKIPPMPQFLTTPAPGPGSASALLRSYELAETPPEGAVKPRGGLFVGPEKEGSGIGKYFKKTKENLEELVDKDQLTSDRAKTIQEFIEKQGKKYLTTVYGTAFDPVREAMLEGRLPLMGDDRESFKSYLMEGLKSKKRDVEAESRSDFEKIYDRETGITSFGYSDTQDQYRSANKRKELQRQKMEEEIKRLKPGEGLEDFAINPLFSPSSDISNFEREYAPQYQKDLAALIKATPKDQKSTVTDPVARGLLEEETVYDVQPWGLDALKSQNVAQALSALTDDELKRRDFPEALIEGSRRVRFEREWEDVLDRAANNKPIPKDLFDIGVEEKLKMGDDRWVRVMTKPAVRLEGKAQHHSVGGYGTSKVYNLGGIKAFDSGKAQVFSLRGSDGYPRVTVEAEQLPDGKLRISQIKGTYNGLPPVEDQKMTIDFLKSLPISRVLDQESYTVDTNNNRLPDVVWVNWRDMYEKAKNQ